MKIAIFTDSFYPQINGVVTSITELIKGMSDKGHKVYVVAPKYKNFTQEFTYPNVHVFRLPAVDASFYEGFKWSAFVHNPTFQELKKNNIDVIHFMTPLTVSIFGILCGKMLKKPIVGTYHTFISELTYLKQLFPVVGPVTQKIAWHYSNAYYNKAHLITAPSEYTSKALAENGCNQPILTVSNGIKVESFNNSLAGEFKKRYNQYGDIVLYVGRVSIEKNMIMLLESYKKVCEFDSTTKFLIVGDGPILGECKKFVSDNNLEDRIIFLGLIPNQELKESGIFGAVKLFTTASTTENQPVTVLEATANGIPSVGPNAKGMPCVIKHEVTGLVVEPNRPDIMANAILRLLNDDILYSKMRQNCYRFIEPHKLENVLNRWEDIYQDLADTPKRHKRKLIKEKFSDQSFKKIENL